MLLFLVGILYLVIALAVLALVCLFLSDVYSNYHIFDWINSGQGKRLLNHLLVSGVVIGFMVSLALAGSLVSKRLTLTAEESSGVLFVLLCIGFGGYYVWDEYSRYGSSSINLKVAIPCALFLLVGLVAIAKKVKLRREKNEVL